MLPSSLPGKKAHLAAIRVPLTKELIKSKAQEEQEKQELSDLTEEERKQKEEEDRKHRMVS